MHVLAALSSWSLFGSTIANHLWQSTVFAAVAGLLTLLLRKNHARTRYWLWLAASLKFLLPFALLVSVGTRMQWWKQAPAAQSQVSIVMDQITQPFAATGAQHAPVILPPAAPGLAMRMLPLALLAVWCLGFAALLIFWCVRWQRITRCIRQCQPLESGRELELLRGLEQSAGITRATRLVSGSAALEPGIVGIIRPVMFLPAGIAMRLNDSQLSAVMMHELCHLRRRDNLAAVLHMLVESVFWFHPLVWWMGARLIDERERACDEEVLALGSEPQAYAEGILKVCEFYLETPLVCVAGITGSNLKKRIEAIMIHRIAQKLELGKKLLLASFAAAALIAPVVFGLFHPAQSLAQSAESTTATTPGFESVFIQPNTTGNAMPPFKIVAGPDGKFVGYRFTDNAFLATNATLPMMLHVAYNVLNSQVTGGPDWVNQKRYDVDARFLNAMDDANFLSLPLDERTKLMDQRRTMLKALLADRFKLTLHHETRELPAYSLVVAPGGARMHEAMPGDTYPEGIKVGGKPIGAGLAHLKKGELIAQGIPMANLVWDLSAQLGHPVNDNTGLTGHYDFTLQWTPGQNKDDSASLIAAMQEQLGLQLIFQTGPVDTIVIDRAEPAEIVAGAAGLLKPVSAQASSGDDPQSSFTFSSVSITPKGMAEPNAPLRTRIEQHNGSAEFENQSLKDLLRVAFGVDGSQISGGPDWIGSNLYDMTVTAGRQLHGDEFRQEFQQLLMARFKLAFHRELRPLPVYELVIGSSGSKLVEVAPENQHGSHFNADNGTVTATGVTMKQLVDFLQPQLGRPVVDKTVLNGQYDFSMTVENWQRTRKLGNGSDSGIDALMRALSEQLGLELKTATDPVEVLVIDHAEPVKNQENLAQNH